MQFQGILSRATQPWNSARNPYVRSGLVWLFAVAIALFWLSQTSAFAGSEPPLMATPGQMNVSAAGAFTYSVPIIVPPGTAGMGPALALDYSNQNGDGPEGIGWALTGLPAITRCPRTMAQDGVHGGVNLNSSDRFCMGGQRLVLIAGIYGQDSSEYRTEIDTYSRIIAHGVAGNGPAWFEVHTKAGQIIELGYTTDSRLLAVKADGTGTMPTARAWAVDKIRDTKGNYLTVSYINDTTNGQTYPLSVHYTANDAAGLTAYNSVIFIYGSRTDVTPYYQAGSVIKTAVLLNEIQTYAGANEVLDYRIGYTQAHSGATHDELVSITQCDGRSPQTCLPPLSFGWQGSRDALTYSSVPQSIANWTKSGGVVVPPTIVPGDFNGDGLTDALVTTPNTGYPPPPCPPTQGGPYFLGSLSGTSFAPITYQATNHSQSPPQTAPYCPATGSIGMGSTQQTVDFVGNGITDLFHTTTILNDSWGTAAISNGSSVNVYDFLNVGILADMDGDGRTDILATGNESFPAGALISNGDGTFHTIAPYWTGGGGVVTVADLDGDGCTDIIGNTSLTTMVLEYSCNPAVASYSTTAVQFAYKLPSGDTVFQTPITGDFNGDGKTDFIDYKGNLFLSTGTGLVKAGTAPITSVGGTKVGDFNGDGKADLVVLSADGTALQIYLSTGNSFVLSASIPIAAGPFSMMQLIVADWNNDGAQDLWYQPITGNDAEILFHYQPELITSVSNGLTATSTVTYGRMNDPSIYTKGTSATYPIQDTVGAQYIVSKLQASDGIGGTYETDYAYAGAKTDLSGRGFLGFTQITATDPQLHTAETTIYRMDFPYTGQVSSRTKVWTPTGLSPVTLDSVSNTFQTDRNCAGSNETLPPYTVELCSSIEQTNDTDGSALPGISTSYTYDTFGNITTSTALVSDGSSRVTTNTWQNDTANWFLGRLLTSNIRSSVPGTSTLTRHTSHTYDPSSGLVTADIVEPQDTGALRLETDYQYDAFGNRHVTNVSGLAATASGLVQQTRPTTATFDARGQFAIGFTNALSESEQWTYNGDYGTPASHTGPNATITSWSYDSLGRVTKATQPDGTAVLYSYIYCSGVNGGGASCPANAAYLVQASPVAPDGVTPSGPAIITYYDTLSRVVTTDTQAFDTSPGQWIRGETHYDTFGHATQVSRPYFLGVETPVFAVSSFVVNIPGDTIDSDPLGRPWRTTAPDGSVTTFGYDGLVSTITNARGATTTTTRNAQGLISLVADTYGQTTSYAYDAFGDMITANPPGSGLVHFSYDLRGHKIGASDQDMGGWSYAYDAFGALYQQTDAKSQTVSMAYDALGRMIARTEPDMTAGWTYGNSLSHHNIDKLLTATCTGAACGPGYTRSYLYDSLARQSRVTVAVSGASYHADPTYDGVTGKLASVRNFSGFTLNYGYTSRGYLDTITDATSGVAYWTANARNASLQLTQSTAGNGVATADNFDPLNGRLLNVCASNHAGSCDGDVANISTNFDPVGNLNYRGDMLHGVTESFGYDLLNRLTNYTVAGGGVNLSRTMSYSPAGSITRKSDLCNTANCFAYTNSAHIHAVSSIAGSYEGVTNPNFFYDANGNLICVTALAACDTGAAKTVAWSSFNMVTSVTEGTSNVGLLYDPEHARVQQSSAIGTTLYLNDPSSGAMVERVAPVTGAVIWRNYIVADGKIVAERTARSQTVTVRYFVSDHLDSTVALTNESGALVESDAYDAWGKQRNASSGADDATCTLPSQSFSNRGFTGQEQMPDGLCLVNLNARIYDPAIGRFMSPDDVIPDLYNGQSWNRYTYVENNPLSYTDPTGHAPEGDLANMSQQHINVYVDSSGEMHAMTGDADLNNMINHALNDAASHGGLSGSHLALAFSGTQLLGAAVFTGPIQSASQSDMRGALAAYVDKHNDSSSAAFRGSSDSDAESRYLPQSQIREARQHTPSEDRAHAQTARDMVMATLQKHPELMPKDLVGQDIAVDYHHDDGPGDIGAHHDIRWSRAPGNGPDGMGAFLDAAGINNNTITMYLGSADTIDDAIKVFSHEIGHHSPDAVTLELQILNNNPRANINTPEVENAADNFAKQVRDVMRADGQ